jgi:site-specific recombinase XerD
LLKNTRVWQALLTASTPTRSDGHAIHLVREGADIRRVQLLLGHRNLNTTSTYLRFKEADLLEMYNTIEF